MKASECELAGYRLSPLPSSLPRLVQAVSPSLLGFSALCVEFAPRFLRVELVRVPHFTPFDTLATAPKTRESDATLLDDSA